MATESLRFKSTNQTWTLKAEDAGYTGYPNSGQFSIYNGATKLWGLNESGWIQNSNIPAFRVNFSGAPISTETTCVVISTEYNNGNHFNTTNSTFTAPIEGYYHFFSYSNFNSSVSVGYLSLNRNGTRSTIAYKSSSDSWHCVTLTDLLKLNAGDTIQFRYYGDPDQGTAWFYGGGCLC